MKNRYFLTVVAVLSAVTVFSQERLPGHGAVFQSTPMIVQFGPGDGGKYSGRMSRVELWNRLRSGSREGLTEIPDLASLQDLLPRHVILAEADLLEYKAKLKVFRYIASEKPNDEFLKSWLNRAGDEKENKGTGGIQTWTPETAIAWLNKTKPVSFYSSWLCNPIKSKLSGFKPTVDSMFTTSEWSDLAQGNIATLYNLDWESVSAIRSKMAEWNNVEVERGVVSVEKELVEVADLVGMAVALSPAATFQDATSDRADSTCRALEGALDHYLLVDLGTVSAPTSDRTAYVVLMSPKDASREKLEPLGFPTEYAEHKFYSLNTAGPFFFDLPAFSYSVKKETKNGVDSFKLVESGKQSSMKSSVGAFYNQMYQVTDQFHLGLSIGVVASENSRIGYGIGLTTRIGGVFLTYGQLYTPVSEARFVPGSSFGTQEDADAAKTLSQDSFKWRPFIGLALKF